MPEPERLSFTAFPLYVAPAAGASGPTSSSRPQGNPLLGGRLVTETGPGADLALGALLVRIAWGAPIPTRCGAHPLKRGKAEEHDFAPGGWGKQI